MRPSRGSANDRHGVPSPAVLALISPLPSQAARPSSDYGAAVSGAAPMNHEAAQPLAAAAIRPVASQPSHSTGPDTVKRPITLVLTAIRMSSVITGTATMPLMTAAQTNARMELMESTFATAPITMAARIVA